MTCLPANNLGTPEDYAELHQLIRLYDAGVSLCAAAEALESLVHATWQMRQEDGDWPCGVLTNDASITVSCVGVDMDGESERMDVDVERDGRFKIGISWDGEEGGECARFKYAEPWVSIEAADIGELVQFLTLAPMIGGEIKWEEPQEDEN
jgi:hypothetical protein